MIRGVGGREEELTYEDTVKDEDSLACKVEIYQIMNGIGKVNTTKMVDLEIERGKGMLKTLEN